MNTVTKDAYEGDIVSRLRNWRGLHLAHSGTLFEEAAGEIARLREAIRRLADQDATISVQGGSVTVTMDATLTESEREAIEQAIDAATGMAPAEPWTIATLRNLLERLR